MDRLELLDQVAKVGDPAADPVGAADVSAPSRRSSRPLGLEPTAAESPRPIGLLAGTAFAQAPPPSNRSQQAAAGSATRSRRWLGCGHMAAGYYELEVSARWLVAPRRARVGTVDRILDLEQHGPDLVDRSLEARLQVRRARLERRVTVRTTPRPRSVRTSRTDRPSVGLGIRLASPRASIAPTIGRQRRERHPEHRPPARTVSADRPPASGCRRRTRTAGRRSPRAPGRGTSRGAG